MIVPSGASDSGHAPYFSASRSLARWTSACRTPRASSSATTVASLMSSIE